MSVIHPAGAAPVAALMTAGMAVATWMDGWMEVKVEDEEEEATIGRPV